MPYGMKTKSGSKSTSKSGGSKSIARGEKSAAVGNKKDTTRANLKKLDAALRKDLAKKGISPTSADYEQARRNQNYALVGVAMRQQQARTSNSPAGTGKRTAPPKRTKRGD